MFLLRYNHDNDTHKSAYYDDNNDKDNNDDINENSNEYDFHKINKENDNNYIIGKTLVMMTIK